MTSNQASHLISTVQLPNTQAASVQLSPPGLRKVKTIHSHSKQLKRVDVFMSATCPTKPKKPMSWNFFWLVPTQCTPARSNCEGSHQVTKSCFLASMFPFPLILLPDAVLATASSSLHRKRMPILPFQNCKVKSY